MKVRYIIEVRVFKGFWVSFLAESLLKEIKGSVSQLWKPKDSSENAYGLVWTLLSTFTLGCQFLLGPSGMNILQL